MQESPSKEEWKRLYELADRIKKIAPWEWMAESDIFGVQNPEDGERGFVSVMGTLGEHYAVAVYRAATGLYRFWAMQKASPHEMPDRLLETPQFQLSFEDRQMLTERDRSVIKDLGLKYRGRQAWPLFRSYQPGYAPWYLEAAEARFLAHALEQAINVVLRFRDEPKLLKPPVDETYLVRVPRQQDNTLVWEDRFIPVPPPEPSETEITISKAALNHLRQLRSSSERLEVDCFWTPAQIQEERSERPRFAYNLLVVDSRSGFVLGTQILTAEPSLEAMWATIPSHLITILARNRIRPREVQVWSPMMKDLVSLVGQEVGFRVKRVKQLRMLESAKQHLLDFLYR